MTDSIPLSEMESGASAKFQKHGDAYHGRIISFSRRQQTDTNNRLLSFDDGSPRWVYIINVEQADGEVVALWAKGGPAKAPVDPATGKRAPGETMLNAIGSAARAAGANGVDVGGELAVAYVADGEPKPGMSPSKLFVAQYRPPAPAAATIPAADLFSNG